MTTPVAVGKAVQVHTVRAEEKLEAHVVAEAKVRGIRSLSSHAESVDVTNDDNGGPSGIGGSDTRSP
jgi:hypothetical protein